MADGIDLQLLPLRHRKAMLGVDRRGCRELDRAYQRRGRRGPALYRAVSTPDLEGIVAERLTDAYHPKLTRWHKGLNRAYSQRRGRAKWFPERRGRRAGHWLKTRHGHG